MQGSITASCGHKLEDGDEGQSIIYGGEDCDAVRGFSPCLFYAHFCTACAEQWRKDGLLFENDAVATQWLHNQRD